jgi:Mg/Co/Ni transporter MgtE|tara:strand:+ start:356 stop:598 length:243 start_codon:yes stop_codon:yes gene_type:complete
MDKNEVISQIANDILNSLNITNIINLLREHSINRATSYYDNLPDEEKSELVNRILTAKTEAEKKQAETEEAAKAEVEVVS